MHVSLSGFYGWNPTTLEKFLSGQFQWRTVTECNNGAIIIKNKIIALEKIKFFPLEKQNFSFEKCIVEFVAGWLACPFSTAANANSLRTLEWHYLLIILIRAPNIQCC